MECVDFKAMAVVVSDPNVRDLQDFSQFAWKPKCNTNNQGT